MHFWSCFSLKSLTRTSRKNQLKTIKRLLIVSACLVFSSACFSQKLKLDSLWKVYNDHAKQDTTRLRAFRLIARSYASRKPDSALLLAGKQMEMAKSLAVKLEEMEALVTQGLALMNKGDYGASLSRFHTMLRMAYNAKDKEREALCFSNLGALYMYKSEYDTALDTLNLALRYYEEAKDARGVATVLSNLGGIYLMRGEYPKALDHYLRALKTGEELNDKMLIHRWYNNVGLIYRDQKNYQKALEYYQKSLEIKKEINHRPGIASAYCSIGTVYWYLKEYDKALDYQTKSLAIREELKEKKGIADCYTNFALIYERTKQPDKVLEYMLKALHILEELGDKGAIANSYLNISEFYNTTGNYKEAIRYANQAIALSDITGQRQYIMTANRLLAQAWAGLGNYKEAYQKFVLFKQQNDSIFNSENSKQLSDLKTNFEVQKKEHEMKVQAEARELVAAAEKKKQQLILAAVAGVLILVTVFSLLLFKRFRITKKQKLIIEAKEQETQKQNIIIQQQKHMVEEKHKEITDSINYAERIQRSFLASKQLLDAHLPEYFVMFKPKDVVSGDFYWASELGNGNFALSTADSTGHGVPGAIMSLLNITSLEKAIEHYSEPHEILNHTRKNIIERLKKDGSAEGGKDGMDCSLICFDRKNRLLKIAAAHNPVWIVRTMEKNEGGAAVLEQELLEIKPDKMPVGRHDKDQQPFTLHTIELKEGDLIYALTDGFPDQFGGEKGKKFMSRNLKELIMKNAGLPMNEQREILESTFNNWLGELEQTDDVTVIGIRL